MNRLFCFPTDQSKVAVVKPIFILSRTLALFSQSSKLKPFMSYLRAFSRASGSLLVTKSSSALSVISFILIGSCEYYAFGFPPLNHKALWVSRMKTNAKFERKYKQYQQAWHAKFHFKKIAWKSKLFTHQEAVGCLNR